jgi:hypothetical protein
MQETTVLSYKSKRHPDPAFIVNLASFWDLCQKIIMRHSCIYEFPERLALAISTEAK